MVDCHGSSAWPVAVQHGRVAVPPREFLSASICVPPRLNSLPSVKKSLFCVFCGHRQFKVQGWMLDVLVPASPHPCHPCYPWLNFLRSVLRINIHVHLRFCSHLCRSNLISL